MMPPQPKLEPSANEALCRHWLGMVIIAALTVTLLPAWDFEFTRIQGELVSFYLLPTMGFWLALRRGAVDLSVWAVAGLGGVVAAMLINAGVPTAAAFALAITAGLAIGAANGYVAAWTRLSSAAFTIIVAAIIVFAMVYLTSERAIRVDDAEFGWLQQTPAVKAAPDNSAAKGETDAFSAHTIRMLLVGGAYALFMTVAMYWGVASRNCRWADLDRRAGPFVAMSASGALAAAGGAFWLIDQGSAPVPTRLIGDLRIPAAALLAGGALWTGRGKTLLSGLFLPVGLLLATVWRQEITHLPWLRDSGYAVQTALLIGLLITAHRALLGALGRRRGLATIHTASLALTLAALVAVGVAALVDSADAGQVIILAAMCLWAFAAAGMVVTSVVCWLIAPPRRQ